MVVPRSWTAIEKQRSLEQAIQVAKPSATDIRFKLAAFFLFGGWLTTIFSLCHSIKHNMPHRSGVLNSSSGDIFYVPTKFLLVMLLSLVMVGYGAACALEFSVSPLNLNTDVAMMYGLGWAPIALILIVYEIFGYLDPNEDRELKRQRRVRGSEINRQLGITPKPHWWRLLHRDNRELNVHDQIARNVGEISGGLATSKSLDQSIQMESMPIAKNNEVKKASSDVRLTTLAVNLAPPDAATNGAIRMGDGLGDGPDRSRNPVGGGVDGICLMDEGRGSIRERSESTNSGVTLVARPQRIRSMLDV